MSMGLGLFDYCCCEDAIERTEERCVEWRRQGRGMGRCSVGTNWSGSSAAGLWPPRAAVDSRSRFLVPPLVLLLLLVRASGRRRNS